MKCEQIAEFLPDYLAASLRPVQSQSVEQHLASCAECSEVVALWQKLGALPEEQPGAEGRLRFEAMLHAYQTGRGEQAEKEKRPSLWNMAQWFRSPAGAVAWSFALLVIGAFVGVQLGSRKQPETSPDVAAMRSELASMRQLVALSMLQQQSASQRLEGVSWTRGEEHLDPQVLNALMHTLRYDPSVDVRLAALDALSRRANAQPQLRQNVVAALQEQQSPLVQVALIDQLVEWRDRAAAQQLQQLRQSPNLNPTVKQRAEWAISKLN
jgi:hypothetical protein